MIEGEERAKAEGAEIHWGDETALVNSDVRGRSYAPAGKTPVAYIVGGMGQKLSMIATVTNQGKARWMIIEEAFNSDKLIEFLEALIKDAGKKPRSEGPSRMRRSASNTAKARVTTVVAIVRVSPSRCNRSHTGSSR